ncbi:thioredoxin family protein [Bacillota bacterium LX-D]|nr:thioredoxin family protein [Bacillota bacterium LX-D]
MEIKILGSGCANCQKLYGVVEQAVQELGIQADMKKVEDMKEIMSHGVMSTPALVINGKVKSFGKVLKLAAAKKYIQEENN